jgi:hypothetical protein
MAETGWFSTYGGTRVAFESFRRESVACGRSGARVLVEKTPKHILSLELIFEHFPSSKVVLIYRDGRDVALSLARRFKYSLDNPSAMCAAATRWVRDNRAAKPHLTDPRVVTVRYERLVAEPHAVVDDIFSSLEGTLAPPEVHAQFNQSGNLSWARLQPIRVEPLPHLAVEQPVNNVTLYENRHLRNWQVCPNLLSSLECRVP